MQWSFGKETMAEYLEAWQNAQLARLKHLQSQLTPAQLEIVDEALQRVAPTVRQSKGSNPNMRGNALYLLCKTYLEYARNPNE